MLPECTRTPTSTLYVQAQHSFGDNFSLTLIALISSLQIPRRFPHLSNIQLLPPPSFLSLSSLQRTSTSIDVDVVGGGELADIYLGKSVWCTTPHGSAGQTGLSFTHREEAYQTPKTHSDFRTLCKIYYSVCLDWSPCSHLALQTTGIYCQTTGVSVHNDIRVHK